MPLYVPPTFGNLGGAVADNAALVTALAAKADLVGGLVPANQLPSFVDDVLEYANAAAFPVTGAAGIIYVALDTSKTYRWSGSAYVFTAGSLTAASQAEMEAGTEASPREMSPLRVAQAIAALGGSAVVQTGVAFVDATVGDDGTGEVGNPAAPFETIQGAFDAGATCFSIAFGNVGPLDVGDWAGTLSFIGVGRGFSSIGAITRTGAAPGLLKLIGNGKDMITVESITNAGTNGANGTNGAGAGDPGTNGGGGEAAGDIEVYGMTVTFSITCVGGDGGAAGHGHDGDGVSIDGGAGGAGGDGGGCGACLVEECYVGGSVLVNGGDGTNGGHGGDDVLVGGNGGNGGSGGAAGALTIRRSTVLAGTSNAGGALGAGGGGGTGAVNGTPGADGVAGAKANFNGYFSESGVPADYDTAVVRAVVIDGTFYADTYP